jgi:hypothetical protein
LLSSTVSDVGSERPLAVLVVDVVAKVDVVDEGEEEEDDAELKE